MTWIAKMGGKFAVKEKILRKYCWDRLVSQEFENQFKREKSNLSGWKYTTFDYIALVWPHSQQCFGLFLASLVTFLFSLIITSFISMIYCDANYMIGFVSQFCCYFFLLCVVTNSNSGLPSDNSPMSPCEHLQLVFALLAFSKRR